MPGPHRDVIRLARPHRHLADRAVIGHVAHRGRATQQKERFLFPLMELERAAQPRLHPEHFAHVLRRLRKDEFRPPRLAGNLERFKRFNNRHQPAILQPSAVSVRRNFPIAARSSG